MRNKTYIVVCAVAALGLSLTNPKPHPLSRRRSAQEKPTLKPFQATHPSQLDGEAGISGAGAAGGLDLAAVSAGAALAGAAPVGVVATEDGVAMAGDGRLGSGSA